MAFFKTLGFLILCVSADLAHYNSPLWHAIANQSCSAFQISCPLLIECRDNHNTHKLVRGQIVFIGALSANAMLAGDHT